MKKKFLRIISAILLTSLLLPAFLLNINAASLLSYENVKRFFDASKKSVTEVYTSTKGTKLPYRMYVPSDYDENESYPLVLFFHGAGESGTDNTHIFRGGSVFQRLLNKTERGEYTPYGAHGIARVGRPLLRYAG